ncbi:MAG: hypothetical protein IKO74_06760 [Selenomonadaceae bacterium]|nr:hypothetical protein [Selenomonadaceae bacterium]
MNFKKRLLVGLLSGAMILTGGQAFANEPEMPDDTWQAEARGDVSVWTKFLAEKYGVDESQVKAALDSGVHFEDINHAAVLAKLSGKSFSEVLAMRVDWEQVAQKLGVTHEQIENFYNREREEQLAKRAGVDVKTLQALLKDGYHPQDIMIAGKIAKTSNKNIKTVLEKRKINNTWEDVAKSFGVDLKKIMPPPHGDKHGKA